ncbi:MAG TPA: xylan 1,4-beta-xylosidase [Streptosporangiaceae bacterium]|nr:xylan 1,4-beta-xylosidase [Streptosporangiaceae bacterium]
MALLSSRQGRHGRRGPHWSLIALCAALAGVLVTAGVLLAGGWRPGSSASTTVPAAPSGPPVSTVGPGAPKDWPSWGFTHTQYSADRGAPEALDAASGALARQPVPQGQAIMGWGADNPEPAPGRFDFTSLDSRIDLIRRTGGTPVLTLCCAPDWMKGGTPDRTDWSHLEDAPSRKHFRDFAALTARVAARYPDVKYYVVWNEFKGFYNNTLNRWDYERYTDLYNEVYSALKAVNPAIKVGGPYMVMNSYSPDRRPTSVAGPWGSVDRRALDAISYWLEHKRGADFMVVDGATASEDRGLVPDPFTALGKFSAITRWLRARDGGLPVWWAEWYVEPEGSGWTDEQRHAVHAAALIEFARSGTATAMYWNPQRPGAQCAGCLWTSTQLGDGGRATPTLELLQSFARWFPPGTGLLDVRASDQSVRVLAQRGKAIVVNTADHAVRARVDGESMDLDPYEVRWIDR